MPNYAILANVCFESPCSLPFSSGNAPVAKFRIRLIDENSLITKTEPVSSVPHWENKSLEFPRYLLFCAVSEWKVVIRDA